MQKTKGSMVKGAKLLLLSRGATDGNKWLRRITSICTSLFQNVLYIREYINCVAQMVDLSVVLSPHSKIVNIHNAQYIGVWLKWETVTLLWSLNHCQLSLGTQGVIVNIHNALESLECDRLWALQMGNCCIVVTLLWSLNICHPPLPNQPTASVCNTCAVSKAPRHKRLKPCWMCCSEAIEGVWPSKFTF